MHTQRRLEQVAGFLAGCDHRFPVQRQLQEFFSAHKSMGARDRREVRTLVYAQFRIGRALEGRPLAERMAVAMFLCGPPYNAPAEELVEKFGWKDTGVDLATETRLKIVQDRYCDFRTEDIFPLADELSDRVNRTEFVRSMLVQPKVWIRVRERFKVSVGQELKDKGFQWETDDRLPLAWSFASSTPLLEMETYRNGCFEIQDVSSQSIGEFLQPHAGEQWWDACAASGGKSLLLLDQEPGVQLTATDVRPSILSNFSSRLEKAGFKGVKSQVVDLSEAKPFSEGVFDAVMADVPCSGSGTWSRTPEMLSFFEKARLEAYYQPLQRSILDNCVFSIKKGGKLVFSTCSVFSIENEANTQYLSSRHGMRILTESYIFGAPKRADSMYVALLIKN